MLFSFLKYLQPTSYFSIPRNDKSYVFPLERDIPKSAFIHLKRDLSFKSQLAQGYDLSWQAINKGFVSEKRTTLISISPIPLNDEYVFIRKYFSSAWVLYVLIIRILSFRNPYKEIMGWYKTKHIKRVNLSENSIEIPEWENFESRLITEKPMVSVIIPTLNRYAYLKDVLRDLEKQDYSNFEVIVIDQSKPFQKAFYSNFNLKLFVAYQEEKALWLARNSAIRRAKGDYLLLFDDDSRVKPDWISQHLRAIDYFNADISSGVSISKVGDKIPPHYSYFRIGDQLDTGNTMVKKHVFKKTGLFDRQFEKQRMGDGEFGLRAYLHGFKNISNPKAKRLHLKVDSGGLREMGSWDAFRTSNLFKPRPIPSVLYFFRRYFGNKQALLAILRNVPIAVVPYRYKRNKSMLVLSGIMAILVFPLILFQIIRSWQLASKKIKQGPMIETL